MFGITVLSADSTLISSAVPTQSTSTSAVAGVAVAGVMVLLVVAGIQFAVIWHLRRYKLQLVMIAWYWWHITGEYSALCNTAWCKYNNINS